MTMMQSVTITIPLFINIFDLNIKIIAAKELHVSLSCDTNRSLMKMGMKDGSNRFEYRIDKTMTNYVIIYGHTNKTQA